MPRILLVEDDQTLRAVTSDALQDSGFEVQEAASADDAIGILERGTAVDLVFTDIRMPGRLDGFGLIEWVRRHRPELPVMITSAHSLRHEVAEHLRRGEQFIAKPADPFRIAEEVRSALRPARKH